MATDGRIDDEPVVVMRSDLWGCCPYCHMRQEWKIRVERSPLWPHPLRCPQCGQSWASVGEFNADAKRLVKRVMRENPGKIENMNRHPEEEEWKTFHNDALMERKERQDRECVARTGKHWSPHMPGHEPITIVNPGVDYGEGQDDTQAEGDAGAVADGPDGGGRDEVDAGGGTHPDD